MAEQNETVDWREGTRLTGLSKSTWYKVLRDRKIPSFKIGSSIRVRRTVLLDFIQRQEQEQAA